MNLKNDFSVKSWLILIQIIYNLDLYVIHLSTFFIDWLILMLSWACKSIFLKLVFYNWYLRKIDGTEAGRLELCQLRIPPPGTLHQSINQQLHP